MAKITFWKWQHTDQFGLPCVTRSRLVSSTEGDRLKDPESEPWTLENRDPKRMPTSEHARSAQK